MKPGYELNALVAEKVLGCKVIRFTNGAGNPDARCGCEDEVHNYPDAISCNFLKDYSTSIEDAWQVVEELTKIDLLSKWRFNLYRDAFGHEATFASTDTLNGRECYGWAKTAPHAICLAALKAVGYNDESHQTTPR